jgi:hypothetical protein
MCRLMLLNREAVLLLENWGVLHAMLRHLECSFGGHGNGVAALWSQSERVSVQKGVNLPTEEAARLLSRSAGRGADWMLFHTRRASSSVIADWHCHPFRSGKLTLAHNGHDSAFARLGQTIGVTDSELIARTWTRLRLPLAALDECTGVFIGFQRDAPFVIKGSPCSDLVAAWHRKTGAVVFASELPPWLAEGAFDQVVEVRRLAWFGRTMDRLTLDVVPYRSSLQRARASHFPRWNPPDRFSANWADLEEEEAAWYEGLIDEEEESTLVSAQAPEQQWERDWRQGRQVEDDHIGWARR